MGHQGCRSDTSRLRRPKGGVIALVQDGDRIAIDIPVRTIGLLVDADVLADRARGEEASGRRAWTPVGRRRTVSVALRAYAAFTSSAARGAVRDVDRVEREAVDLRL